MIIIKNGDRQIYHPLNPGLQLINPRLILEDNAAGSLSFKIYSDNLNYGTIRKLFPVLSVIRNDKTIFKGRVVSDKKDFYNGKSVEVEGKLAFFNDSQIEPFEFTGKPEELLSLIVESHNSQVMDWQRFKVGVVTVTDPNDYIVRASENSMNTWKALKEKCFNSSLGGHIRIRYEDDGDYIDWLTDYEAVSKQSIEFAKNMIDLSTDVDATATYTAIRPIGAEVEGKKIDIASVNKGKNYLVNEEKAAEYGIIFAPVEESTWTDVTLPENLLRKAEEKLYSAFATLKETYEVRAVDLNLTDESIEALNICEYVSVVSRPHGINGNYLLHKAEIHIAQPQNSVFYLGASRYVLSDMNSGVMGQPVTIPKNISTFENDAHYISVEETEEMLSGYSNTEEVQEMVNVAIEGVSQGNDGLSAYEVARKKGFEGTEEEWLESLKGKDGYTPQKGTDYFDGEDGQDGQDGYTPQKGVDYFDGEPGEDGATPTIGENGNWFINGIDTGKPSRGEIGNPGQDGQDGSPGADGKSAYEIALAGGFEGSQEEWLASLKGDPGETPDVSIFALKTDIPTKLSKFNNDMGYATKSEAILFAKDFDTVTGSNLILKNSMDDKPLEISIYGKTTQFRTVGKNLLNNVASDKALYGITFGVNEDGSVTMSGVSTENIYFDILPITTIDLLPGNYILSGTESNSFGAFLFLDKNNADDTFITEHADKGNGVNFSITEDEISSGCKYLVRIFVPAGETITDITFYPMIRLSTEDSTYEPYTGGRPSPNPDYPQEIIVAGEKGSVECRSCGKNCLPYPYLETTKTINGLIFTDNKDGTVTVSGMATEQTIFRVDPKNYQLNKLLKPNTRYRISGGLGSFDTWFLFIYQYKEGKNLYVYENDVEMITGDYIPDDININITIRSGIPVNNITFSPMICLADDENTAYEQYKETLSTISAINGLAGVPVASGGNYMDETGQQWVCDEIVKHVDGTGEYVQRVYSYTFTGTENFVYNSASGAERFDITNETLSIPAFDTDYVHRSIMNRFLFDAGYKEFGKFTIQSKYLIFGNTDLRFSSADELKKWLAENETIFIYIMQEPITTQLTAEEIVEIEKLHTFHHITNISNDAGSGMKVTYPVSETGVLVRRLYETINKLKS